MLAKVFSATSLGLDGVCIEVEVDVAMRGFPTFTIVGLPTKGVDEAKDRVRTAIVNGSLEMPDSKITVNLAPADIPKTGTQFDLPIAVGILAASGMIERELLSKSMFIGELSLEGQVRRVPGVISFALLAREKKLEYLFVPVENAYEASLIEGITVYPVHTVSDLVLHLNKQKLIEPFPCISIDQLKSEIKYPVDFADVRGQEQAKRALEIAAAGFHNVHLKGPPGTGKTLLSKTFPTILPPLEKEEILEVSKVYSNAGILQKDSFMICRPFRAPHHTTSRIGLIGGGSDPGPGEISLAHRGVLFLDEFPEFPRSVLESLRQPVEDGVVTISRASGSLTFPARFLLLAASNPCPCGYLGHPKKSCKCHPSLVLKYKKRISGPLMDRIDLHVDVPVINEEKLMSVAEGERSADVRERVLAARARQRLRLGAKTNAEMTPIDIKKTCVISAEATELLKRAIHRLSLSARSYFKIVKVSQTIADLAASNTIEQVHVAEALQFRMGDD